jgi:hypothetical protein
MLRHVTAPRRRSWVLALALLLPLSQSVLLAQGAPAVSRAVTYGRITTTSGDPVVGAVVRTSRDESACGGAGQRSGRRGIVGSANLPTRSGGTGEYRLEVISLILGSGCVVLYIDPPAGHGWDVAVLGLPNVRFVVQGPTDSIRADITLPPLTPAEPPPGALGFRAVSAGATHTCAIAVDDGAWCWGANDEGQLGAATTARCRSAERTIACSREPVAVAGGLRVAQLSAGDRSTCAVASDGRLFCWGAYRHAPSGVRSRSGRPSPALVRTALRFREVHVGSSLTCGLTVERQAACWGTGALWTAEPTLLAGGHRFERLAVGATHACASNRDGTYCWGEGTNGVFGDGTPGAVASRAPVRVAPPNERRTRGPWWHVALAAGANWTCALDGFAAEQTLPPDDTDSGTVYCWGGDAAGRVVGHAGFSSVAPATCGSGASTVPCALVPRSAFQGFSVKLEAGEQHVCVILSGSQHGHCWGNDGGAIAGAGRPVHWASGWGGRLEGGLPLSAIAVGRAHGCGLTGESIYCWGENGLGQLGDRTSSTRWRPVRVAGSR